MKKVQFLKNINAVSLDLPENTLVVYHAMYFDQLPAIDAEYIEFQDYKKKYTMLEPEMIVVIGLNRIITPSNRCDFINEYLQTMTPNIEKISIDTEPFIGEPWRLWYHYSIANCGHFNITYSYAIETEWQYWFYRDVQECRLSGENIRLFISDTWSNIEPLTTQFEFYQPNEIDKHWYHEIKKHIFISYDTPKLLINNLLKLSNKRFDINLTYDSFRKNQKIILPDLNIFRFVAEENIRRMKIFNAVVSYEEIFK